MAAQICASCGTACVATAPKCDCGRPFNPADDQRFLAEESKKLIRFGLEMIALYLGLTFLFALMGWHGRGGGWVLIWAIYRILKGLKLRKRMQR